MMILFTIIARQEALRDEEENDVEKRLMFKTHITLFENRAKPRAWNIE